MCIFGMEWFKFGEDFLFGDFILVIESGLNFLKFGIELIVELRFYFEEVLGFFRICLSRIYFN